MIGLNFPEQGIPGSEIRGPDHSHTGVSTRGETQADSCPHPAPWATPPVGGQESQNQNLVLPPVQEGSG